MKGAGIGRVLVASLHQGIADLLPSRLEFYENWFNPIGLREGTIGLAPLAAVLSFLRREGHAYGPVTERAGEYAADWTVAGLSPLRLSFIRALPAPLRRRAALRVCRELVSATYSGSRAVVSVRGTAAAVDLRSSIFCGVREPATHPLCGFYAAAFTRVLARFDLAAAITVARCRGAGETGCLLAVSLPPATVEPLPAIGTPRSSQPIDDTAGADARAATGTPAGSDVVP